MGSLHTEEKILVWCQKLFTPSTVVVNFWKQLSRVIWDFDWWRTSSIVLTTQQFQESVFISLVNWYVFKDGTIYILEVIKNTFHRHYIFIRKLFFAHIARLLQHSEHLTVLSIFKAVWVVLVNSIPWLRFVGFSNLEGRNFSEGSEPCMYFTEPLVVSFGMGSPKDKISTHLGGSCQGRSCSEHLKRWE